MAGQNQHIIQKQFFNLTLRESKDSFAIQQRISTSCKERVTPLLNEIFDRLVNEEDLIQIDHLEIDIGSITPEELERVLPEKIAEAIEQKIEQLIALKSPTIRHQALNINHFEAWLNYLEKGVLSWQMGAQKEQVIQKGVLESLALYPESLHKFRDLILGKSIVLERLVRQSEETFLVLLLQASFGKKQISYKAIREQLERSLIKLSSKTSNELFAQEKINLRTYFISFWKTVLRLSFQNNESIKPTQLIAAVLETISQNPKPSKELIKLVSVLKKEKLSLDTLEKVLVDLEQDIEKRETLQEQENKSAIENTRPKDASEKDLNTNKEKNEKAEIAEKESLPKKIEKQDPEQAQYPISETEETKESKPKSENTQTKEIEKETEKIKEQRAEENKRIDTTNGGLPKEEELKSTKIPIDKDWEITPLSELPEGSHFYLQNAGMVLLHPFLKTYFDTLGLLEEEEFKNVATQERAVHLLHYLSSGTTMQPEYDLVLSKYLCGIPLNYPVDRMVELMKTEKEEGNHLLQTIINHWGALGEVKPDSLQEGFLQRPGKLEKRASGWYLMVEHKTIDILLNQLPWGISLIKLPWMPEMLKVEWTS